MVDVKLMNKGLSSEYVELSETKTEKRNIDYKAIEDILASLEEQRQYWVSVKAKADTEKAKI